MNTPLNNALRATLYGALTAFIIAALCLMQPLFTIFGTPDYIFSVLVTILGSYLGLKLLAREGAVVSPGIGDYWTQSWHAWGRNLTKHMAWWCLAGVGLYVTSGLLFPLSLWHEFQTGGYGSRLPDGSIKLTAGLMDYARLYPHMVLYPLCWFIFAAANLVVALNTLDRHAGSSARPRAWRMNLYLPLAFFAMLAGIGTRFEASSPNMMLFEISPAAQKELVTSVTNDIPVTFQQYTIAEVALLPILWAKEERPPEKVAALRTPEASVAREKIFAWDETWSKHQDKLSWSRYFYLLTFAGLLWAMYAMLWCVFLVASLPQEAPARRPALLGTIGAILGIVLWLPHRLYYNVGTKAILFPPEKKDIFNLWIPKALSDRGITETEAIPLSFLLIASLVIVVMILFKIPKRIAEVVVGILKMFGFIGAVVLLSLLVGLNGNWGRFILVSCLLLVWFVAYISYAVSQAGGAFSVQRRDGDPKT